jgi:DNA repair exonuclease SbcCD ATPase subunit
MHIAERLFVAIHSMDPDTLPTAELREQLPVLKKRLVDVLGDIAEFSGLVQTVWKAQKLQQYEDMKVQCKKAWERVQDLQAYRAGLDQRISDARHALGAATLEYQTWLAGGINEWASGEEIEAHETHGRELAQAVEDIQEKVLTVELEAQFVRNELRSQQESLSQLAEQTRALAAGIALRDEPAPHNSGPMTLEIPGTVFTSPMVVNLR